MGKKDEGGNQWKTGWRYTRHELYELSAVPVPANPEVLMNTVQRGRHQRGDGRQDGDGFAMGPSPNQ
jgi:hypothetical protein